jgi:hypothetical protein
MFSKLEKCILEAKILPQRQKDISMLKLLNLYLRRVQATLPNLKKRL